MQWISVKDKLPKDYQAVLAYGIVQHYSAPFNRCIVECWYEHDCFVINQEIRNEDDNEVLDVTHWMPIPELPKE